jgi:hypothetical protein
MNHLRLYSWCRKEVNLTLLWGVQRYSADIRGALVTTLLEEKTRAGGEGGEITLPNKKQESKVGAGFTLKTHCFWETNVGSQENHLQGHTPVAQGPPRKTYHFKFQPLQVPHSYCHSVHSTQYTCLWGHTQASTNAIPVAHLKRKHNSLIQQHKCKWVFLFSRSDCRKFLQSFEGKTTQLANIVQLDNFSIKFEGKIRT